MNKKTINVLIADDSKVSRLLLAHLLESDPSIHVLGTVHDGQAALDFVNQTKPDVVVMDVHMPQLDGFEATRKIMETQPVPIVICSSTTNPRDAITAFRLMEAGAVACVEKPVGSEHSDFEELAANLLQTVKLMSEVKVVRRWPRNRLSASSSAPLPPPKPEALKTLIVGIGASTGGPPVLQTILSRLPKDFPATLLIVQHISRGFVPGLVEWLNQTTGLQIHVAAHETVPLPGHAYFAPDDYHLALSDDGRIRLSREGPENGLRPAVSYLFRSLSETCPENAIGVILSGMGVDGAAELKLMRDSGAVTIAQDRESSVVHGMPGEAIALGGAMHIVSAENIAGMLTSIVNRKRNL